MSKFISDKNRQIITIVVDLIMIAILILNLLWIVFDWLFGFQGIQEFLQHYLPALYEGYLPVHNDFQYYDFIFVGIFVTELFIRWAIAIKNRKHHRWFFYPFIHWYDVLGCIPVGSLRWLRLLRIFSIVYRFQKLQIIDITKNYIYQQGNKYWGILMEEVSDRVIVNILDGVQTEIKDGSPVTNRIMDEIVEPHKPLLVELITDKLQVVIKESYASYRPELQEYINQRIHTAVKDNSELKLIEKVPVFGDFVSITLEKAIADIVFNVFNGIMADLGNVENDKVVAEVVENALENILTKDKMNLDKVGIDVVMQAIELIKDHVKIQQWKVKEEKDREKRRRAKAIKTAEKQRKKEEKKLLEATDEPT